MVQNLKYTYFILVPFLIVYPRFGTHALVCCPGYSSSVIFFPRDPSHPDYENVAEDYYDVDSAGANDYYDSEVQISETPKVTF